MTEDKNIKDAINSFVESLEKEQKRNILIENSPKSIVKDKVSENDGLEKIKGILKKSLELICPGEDVKIEADSEELRLSVQGEDLGIAIGREGRKIALKPMGSYERKIIHNLLAKFSNITTRSRYDEPDRRIIIYPVKSSK